MEEKVRAVLEQNHAAGMITLRRDGMCRPHGRGRSGARPLRGRRAARLRAVLGRDAGSMGAADMDRDCAIHVFPLMLMSLNSWQERADAMRRCWTGYDFSVLDRLA